jgi:hypothetical protein
LQSARSRAVGFRIFLKDVSRVEWQDFDGHHKKKKEPHVATTFAAKRELDSCLQCGLVHEAVLMVLNAIDATGGDNVPRSITCV